MSRCLALIVAALLVGACAAELPTGHSSEPNALTGRITRYQRTGNAIGLFVDGSSPSDTGIVCSEQASFGVNEQTIVLRGGRPVTIDALALGQLVRVTPTGIIRASCPAQATAGRMEIE